MPASAQAIRLKDVGNESFQEGNWGEACAAYTDALDALAQAPDSTSEENVTLRAVIYSNRAATSLQMRTFGRCIRLKPDTVKALYRRGLARENLGEFDAAMADLAAAVALLPVGSRGEVQEALDRVRLRKKGRGPPLPGPFERPPDLPDEQLAPVIQDSFRRVIEKLVVLDVLPTYTTERLLGIWHPTMNVARARRGALQAAVRRHGLTDEQLTTVWLRGGTEFQELLLSFPDVRETVYGQYLSLRGGFLGRASSTYPQEPDIEEELPEIPGARAGYLSLAEELELLLRSCGRPYK